MVAEIPRLWLGKPVPMRLDGESILETAYGGGKGVIFLTPHLGCFESTAQILAERMSPRFGPLTVLYRPPRQAWLQTLTEASRKRPGLETAPTTLPGVRQMIKALRQGRAVGLLPDQVPPDGQGIWSEAFGKPAYTMTLAARLALQTGAALVPLWGERLPGGQGFVVHVRPPLALPDGATLEDTVARINHAIEAAILECPEQYLWGYGRYKTPRPVT
jgi:KDO2-lipid IV(A) lauroyltransferase